MKDLVSYTLPNGNTIFYKDIDFINISKETLSYKNKEILLTEQTDLLNELLIGKISYENEILKNSRIDFETKVKEETIKNINNIFKDLLDETVNSIKGTNETVINEYNKFSRNTYDLISSLHNHITNFKTKLEDVSDLESKLKELANDEDFNKLKSSIKYKFSKLESIEDEFEKVVTKLKTLFK